MSIKSVMPSNLCHPLFFLLSIFPSIRVFSNESVLCIRRPKYWSFSFSISPSNEYSGLISFRMDRFDLLAVQGTLKSLLQHHSSKAVNSSFYGSTFTSIHDYWKKTELWLDRPLSAKSVPQPSDYFQSICSSDCKVVVPIGSDFAPQRAIDNVWRHF